MAQQEILPLIEGLLREANWHPDRNIPLDQLKEAMAEYGDEFPALNSYQQFYMEFGELTLGFYNPATQRDNVWEIDFQKGTELLFYGDIEEEYLPRVSSECLIPIGYWNNAARILLIDEKNYIYLGEDHYLALLGHSFLEAFYHVVNGINPITVFA